MEKTRLAVRETLPLNSVAALWGFRTTGGLYGGIRTTPRDAPLPQTDSSSDMGGPLSDR